MLKYFIITIILLTSNLSAEIRGIISDSLTHEPIEGALVKPSGMNLYSITDSKGNFSMQFSHFTFLELIVSHPDYNTKKLIVKYEDHHNINVEITKVGSITKEIQISAQDYDIIDSKEQLSGLALDRKKSITLAQTISDLPGLSVRSMGNATSRPVLRGLGSYRMVIAENSLPINDLSATSPDHAVTANSSNAEDIQLFTGPDILIYSNSLAGAVVNQNTMNSTKFQPQNTKFDIFTGFESATNSALINSKITYPVDIFAFSSSIDYKNSQNINSPEGQLSNTESDFLNGTASFAFYGNNLKANISASGISSNYGIPGGFVGSHPNGVDITMIQQNQMFDLSYCTSGFLNLAGLKLKRSYYNHKEFENSGIVGAEFVVREYSGKFYANHNDNYIFDAGTFGLDLAFREHLYGGFVFTAPTDELIAAPYWVFKKSLQKFDFKFGARYETRLYYPDMNYFETSNIERNKQYNLLSASLDLIYNLTSNFSIGSVISHSERAPSVDELYKEGPHLAAYSFEVGNLSLNREIASVYELKLKYESSKTNINANIFLYDYQSFITPRNSGDTNWATLLPIFVTSEIPAYLTGADIYINNQIVDDFWIDATFNYVYGVIKEANSPLPMIPPFNARISLKYQTGNYNFSINSKYASAQNRLDQFEESTEEYLIFGLSADYAFSINNSKNIIILDVENIFNQTYRNHLSRIKSIFPEAGINIRINYKLSI